MIFPDHKKAVSVILSRLKPDGEITKGPEVKPELSISDKDQSLQAIAQDMMTAFHDKSPNALVSAMRAFISESNSGEE